MDNVICNETFPGSVQEMMLDWEAIVENCQLDFPGDEATPRVRNAKAAVRKIDVRWAPLGKKCDDRPWATVEAGVADKNDPIPF